MPLDWETYQGRNPEIYGRLVIDRCGFTEPPICERTVSQFFGNEVREVSPKDPDIASRFPSIAKIFRKSSAHLFREHSLIVVNKDQPRVKIRMDVFHENGHEALPWQRESPHVCADSGIDAKARAQVESDAFDCGIAMMLPENMFRTDTLGQNMSEKVIRALAHRYEASLEVTAMRYVKLSPNPCAMIVYEPITARQKDVDFSMEEMLADDCKSIRALPVEVQTHGGALLTTERECPLQIRYCVRSPRFKKFFRSGAKISTESPVCYTFQYGETYGGLLHPDDLGSGHVYAQSPYYGECFKFGSREAPKVMALLWEDDAKQGDLF